jgi:hypothetical protein
MKVNQEYWKKPQPHPLNPNKEDVRIYQEYSIGGSTLLLGCTKKLVPISDKQMDLEPWIKGPNVIQGNWIENKEFYQNIIGDGVLNLNKELAKNVFKMAQKCCKNFVVRSFKRKQPEMRIAEYFPEPKEFKITPYITRHFQEYYFFVWRFQ